MAKILRFIQPEHSFDPATIAVLSAAYDKATVGLNDWGLPSVVREMIAVRVIAFGLKGERDPDRLCAAALAAVGITP
jgi:hypothetical protein